MAKESIFSGKGLRFRYAYDGREAEASLDSGISFSDPSLAQQHDAFENDPNTVMERFLRHGDVTGFHGKQPMYVDLIGMPSTYHEALNVVLEAQESFMSLPARARARFDNDPAKFMEFISNPDNRQEALTLGLLKDQLSTEAARDSNAQAAASVDNSSTSSVNPPAPPRDRRKTGNLT